jgi:diacylglycerol kinase family enzyme
VEAGAGLIIAMGGDGTVNEAMNGMVYSNVPLAALPGGTANVLTLELGLGTRAVKAAAMLADCIPERVAVGRLRDTQGKSRYFLLMCGAGLDAKIVYDVHAWLKSRTGKLAYWVAGVRQLIMPLAQLDVTLNGRSFNASFALFSRVQNYGGDLRIAATGSLLQDDFEVVLFEGTNPLRYIKFLGGLALGRLNTMGGVRVMHTRQAELAGPARVQVDGEYVGRLPVTVELIPRALTVLVPPDLRQKIPVRVSPLSHPVWITSPTP